MLGVLSTVSSCSATIEKAVIPAYMWRSPGWEFEPLPLLFHIGEKRTRNWEKTRSTKVVLHTLIRQITLLFFMSLRIAVQLSSTLISLCLMPKEGGIFNNGVLSCSSWGQTRTMVMTCILWGSFWAVVGGGELTVFYIQDHMLNITNLPDKGWTLMKQWLDSVLPTTFWLDMRPAP